MTRSARIRDLRGEPGEAYAPYPLSVDPARFGLESRVFVTRLGLVSARVSPRRSTRTALVLLHGAAGSWSTWTPLLDEVHRQGLELPDLVIVDLPGWGDSPLPPARGATGHGARGIEGYSATVVDVLSSLGYRSWRVVGHSLGGFIGLHLAAVQPVATLAVGLVSPATFSVADATRHRVRGLLRLPAFAALALVMRAFSPFGDTASAVLRGLRSIGLLRLVVSPLFAWPAGVPGSVIDALAVEVRPAAFTLATRGAARYDLADSWRRILAPVRSIRGERDVFVTAGDDRRLAETVHDFGSVVLPAAGHFAHVESPAAVLAALGDVLAARPCSPAG